MKTQTINNTVFFLSFFLFFFGCKPKTTTESITRNKEAIEVLHSKEVFDTLTFVASVHSSPCGLGRYALASHDSLEGNDLDYISPRELRLIRNEIFARYWYKFKDPALQTYFAKQDWYKPLFDDVESFLTPLERANIKFIQEKERTNSNISDKEQFQVFLEKLETYFEDRSQYRWNPDWAPKMLRFKYYVSDYCFVGGSHFYIKRLPPTKNYEYLIHVVFGGWDGATYPLVIFQFNKNGELLERYYLGESDTGPFIDKKTDNRYEIWFTYYTGDRDDIRGEENYEELMKEREAASIDTIRFQFHYDRKGQIIIEKWNN